MTGRLLPISFRMYHTKPEGRRRTGNSGLYLLAILYLGGDDVQRSPSALASQRMVWRKTISDESLCYRGLCQI